MSEIALHAPVAEEPTYEENAAIREQAEEYFPLTAVEKKLCAISFGTGVVLLVVFLALFRL